MFQTKIVRNITRNATVNRIEVGKDGNRRIESSTSEISQGHMFTEMQSSEILSAKLKRMSRIDCIAYTERR